MRVRMVPCSIVAIEQGNTRIIIGRGEVIMFEHNCWQASTGSMGIDWQIRALSGLQSAYPILEVPVRGGCWE